MVDYNTFETLFEVQVGKGGSMLYEPYRSGDTLYINSSTFLFAIDLTKGIVIHRKKLPSFVSSAPLVTDGYLIFGGYNHRAFAMDKKSFFVYEEYLMKGRLSSRPLLIGEDIFVVDEVGNYAALKGEHISKVTFTGHTLGMVTAQPVAGPHGIYVASEDQSLYCLNKASLNDRWRYFAQTPLKKRPLLIGDRLFIPVNDNMVHVIDAVDGPIDNKPLWIRDYCKPLYIKGDRILLSTPESLEIVNKNTGHVLVSVPTTSVGFAMLVEGDRLLLASPYGQIVVLEPIKH